MPIFDPYTRLLRAIVQMTYDDALHFIGTPDDPIALSPYHVEYLYLAHGYVQYRLYHNNGLVGLADVRQSRDNRKLKQCQRQMSAYLLTLDGVGEMHPRLFEAGTITPLDADTSRCLRLPLPDVADDEGVGWGDDDDEV
ncbi:MAG: hypothetical protein KJ043_11540 [Anaerolineae bacterium]|nr:hypothetical protein [Anaerolineae bacterium]